MRIATWNINGVRARLDYVERWLAERKPDLLGVQELKSEDEEFPYDEFSRLGYHAVVHGQKAWNGVAVLSRDPVEVTQVGLPGREDDGARLLAVQHGELHFVTVYCPNGKTVDHADYARKLDWFGSLIEFLEARYAPDQQLILCGDFNVVPGAADSWAEDLLEGGILHTPAERGRIEALLQWGLTDVWRARYAEKPGFTWWDYRNSAFKKRRGLRIDFMLATTPVVERVRFIQPDPDWREYMDDLIPSDHAPLYMDLGDD